MEFLCISREELAMQNSNPYVQRISHQGVDFCIVVKGSLPFSGYNFVSQDKDELQLGVNHYKKGTVIKPHKHLPLAREIKTTVEVLHIDSGKCQMTLYDNTDQSFADVSLESGDTVVLLAGGHGLRVDEDTRIVEVKQGPYYGADLDKTQLKGK
jgi:cupin fold WbuC family metalloprotein